MTLKKKKQIRTEKEIIIKKESKVSLPLKRKAHDAIL